MRYCSSSKLRHPVWHLWLCVALLGWMLPGLALAQSLALPELKLERNDEGVWLSTTLQFELPAVVEDALTKGIPVHFVAQVDVVRERWYWLNQKINSVARHFRLAYHPLTRRWRLNVSADQQNDLEQGLTLNQNFDDLQDALSAVKRFSHWRISEPLQLAAGGSYGVEFRFSLDVTQLPRPLQIGTLGQSDWQISINAARQLKADLAP